LVECSTWFGSNLAVQSRDEMVWMKPAPLGLGSPLFVDEFEDGYALEGLQSLGEVVGVEECRQVLAQALMALVVIGRTVASLMVRFILST